ncbi:hypothetical protein HYDPIDRAFT_28715 [Hydnomerulius pinastri MD-312]|uniref:Uncharacterized protein n=1 Tax=Hydnomerulius pinastri MD-312 TaxID=994086 RepID=A0A0C9VFI7_9AGAM|nr:hypothetical protein HYDPIDRAFT_28715 [Hydnomerulius pinastri MD-312]
MKFTTAGSFVALLASCAYVSAGPQGGDITTHTSMILPSGIPATSGLPFSSLSFDTTGASSVLSSLSSLISSESNAVSSALTSLTDTPSSSFAYTPITTNSAGQVVTSVVSIPTPSPSQTGTGGALGLRSVGSGVVAGVVVGAVAVLL